MSERDMTRVGNEAKPSASAGPQLLNSKSVPTLHHIGKLAASVNSKIFTQPNIPTRQSRKQVEERA